MTDTSALSSNVIETDVVILGAGPAGLSAAIYTSRSKLNTYVLDIGIIGGQVVNTYHIANYPGTQGLISGFDLIENMKEQAISFGTEIREFQDIKFVSLFGDTKIIKTEKEEYHAKSVIIATGAAPRRLPIINEQDFFGKGIHYCATCDGAFYKDLDLVVVGGGMSALEEAHFLTKYAKSVTIINRKNTFKAPKKYVEEITSHPKIKVFYDSVVDEANGEDFLQSITIKNTNNHSITQLNIDGVFVYIGFIPSSSIFKDELTLTQGGYIVTDDSMQTEIIGVYACGDVRDKQIKQIATATGDGVVAGIMAERYLSSHH